jgi:hypothetical protein
MNFGGLLKAFDAVMAFRDAAKRFKGEAPAETALSATTASAAQGLAGQIEARLTNVVVAALKEAFDRDHARLELERAQLEEQRRRAEETLRLELRRQSIDRELARLRLISAGAMVGWITSLILVATVIDALALPGRVALVVGWVLLLGALGAAFTAQGRVDTSPAERDGAIQPLPAATASLWLLLAGLAVTAGSLLLF